MFEQKRFAERHLLTFESQKLNYFGKKSGSGVLTLQCNSYFGVPSCCLTPSILFNFRYKKKIKTYMANLFTYFDGALPQLFTEMKVC
jgi:hypothetical protein